MCLSFIWKGMFVFDVYLQLQNSELKVNNGVFCKYVFVVCV